MFRREYDNNYIQFNLWKLIKITTFSLTVDQLVTPKLSSTDRGEASYVGESNFGTYQLTIAASNLLSLCMMIIMNSLLS